MPELETLLRAARPHPGSPPTGAEERLLGALGLAGEGVAPRAWARRLPRSRRLRLVAVGLVLAGSGAALAVAITARSGAGHAGPAASLAFGPAERAGVAGPAAANDPSAAVTGDGAVVATWSAGGRVLAARRAPGGDWSAQRPLSPPGVLALRPAVAGGAADAAVVWRQRVRGREVSERLTLPGGRPAGRLTAHPRVRWRVMARVVGPGSGPPRALSPAYGGIRDGDAPRVVATRGGGMVAGWAAGGAVHLAARTPGGDWGAPVSPGPSAGVAASVRLSAGPATDWVVATWWTRTEDAARGRTWRPWVALRPPDGTWQVPTALDAPSIGWSPIAAAVDARGDAVAAWGGRVATRDGGGSWSSAADLPGGRRSWGTPDGAGAGIDGEGRALVAATHLTRREPGGGWSAPVRIPAMVAARTVLPDAAGGLVVAGVAPSPRRTALLRLDRDGRTTATAILALPTYGPAALAVGADGTTASVAALRSSARTAVEARVAEPRP